MMNALRNHLQNYALHHTRLQLLRMSDRQLEDIGISRALLQQGISQWPWREGEHAVELADQPAKMNEKDINSAIRELSGMSDQELRDIGIDRGTIRESVMHGIGGQDSRRAA